MKKILRNGMLIIIVISIITYLIIGFTSIYRSNKNRHNNLLNNVDNELVHDNENNSSIEKKDNSTKTDKNTTDNSNKDNSSSSSKNNSSSSSSKNNSSSSSSKNNSSSSSSKNNSSSSSSKNNSSSSSNKNNSSSSSSKNNSSSSNNNSSNSNNNSSSGTKPSQTVKVTSVSLNKTSAEIYLNNSTGFSVSATVSPSNATNKNITWSSSNSNIASVNNGYITAHNPGAATITVKTVDGNKQASINVVVKKKVIVIIGASQVTRMVWYKNSYSSSKYKYNVDNGTLVYVNESGTGIDWQNSTGISRAKSIIGKYSSYKNYTYFYVFFPLSGNTIQSFSCDEISSTNSTIKKFASGYNTSIQSIKNSGYNVKGYVASMHPVRVSQRGNNTKIVTNEDSNSCTKSYRSNYKYYKFNLAMKSIVESSYSNNLKYEPLFIQIMDTKQGKKVNFSYKITYNTTDGMHWDSNTTNTYVNMLLGYINEL